MLTFTDYEVDLRSIPGEICLTFYICDCPCHCHGCSSPWLWERGKYELTVEKLTKAVKLYPYITCVLLMGGDNDHVEIARLADWIRQLNRKAAFYSGMDNWDLNLQSHLDYYKIGHWDESRGPLNARTTNQVLFRRDSQNHFINITSMFWTKENEWKPQQEEQIKADRAEWLQGLGAADAKRS